MVTTKEYYTKNREKVNAYQRKYRANSDKWKESNRRWMENNPEKMKAYRAKYYASAKGRLTQLKCRASWGNINFAISLEDFTEWLNKQNGECHYCKAKLNVNKGHKMLDGDSIDRKDNNKGYTIDNIVLSCNRCNMAKGSWFTEQQMLEIAGRYFNNGK